MLVTVTQEDHETRSVNRGRQVEVGGVCGGGAVLQNKALILH